MTLEEMEAMYGPEIMEWLTKMVRRDLSPEFEDWELLKEKTNETSR
jgi:hypothetical protein